MENENEFFLSLDDPMGNIIKQLFGYEAGTSQLASIFLTFNSALLVVAGIMLAYALVMGIASTANDGEVMGKGKHTLWMPVRYFVGIATLFPMVNGVCLMQAFVLWMILQGVGFANTVWGKFNGTTQYSYTSIDTSSQIKELAFNMLKSNVCIEGQKIYSNSLNTTAQIDFFADYNNYHRDGLTEYSIKYGSLNNSACGSVTLSKSILKNQSDLKLLGKINLDLDKMTEIREANIKQLVELDKELNKIAKEIVTNEKKPDNLDSIIDSLSINYSTKVNATAKTVFDSLSDTKEVQDEIKSSFMYAGAYFLKINQVKESVNGLTIQVAKYNNISKNSSLISEGRKYVGYLDNEVAFDKDDKADSYDPKEDKDVSSVLFDKAFSSITNTFENVFSQNNDKNLLSQALDIATKLQISGMATLGIGAGTSILSSSVGSVILSIGMALLAFSGVLSVVLPMTPYVIWILALVSFLIMTVECVIGASFIALSLMQGEDNNSLGGAKRGLMMAFTVACRPVLMVLGLIFAIVLLEPVSEIFNMTFSIAFNNTSAGIVSLIFGLIVYIGLILSICFKLFDLINVLPNQVLKYFDRYDVHSGSGDSAEKHTNTALVNNVSNKSQSVGQGVGQGLGKVSPKPTGGAITGASGGKK